MKAVSCHGYTLNNLVIDESEGKKKDFLPGTLPYRLKDDIQMLGFITLVHTGDTRGSGGHYQLLGFKAKHLGTYTRSIYAPVQRLWM